MALLDALLRFLRPQEKAKAKRLLGAIPPGPPRVASEVKEVPRLPGIYYIKTKRTGRRIYIGMSSKDMRSRLRHHVATGKFNPKYHNVSFLVARTTATLEGIRVAEKRKIQKHRPPLNQRGGGGGRPGKVRD